jgi:N-acetylmuramoyl-L-alanine amidase
MVFLVGIFAGSVNALTDEEKRQMFLRAREEMRAVPKQTPQQTMTPKPKPKPATRKTPAPMPSPKPTPTTKPTPTGTPRLKARPAQTPGPTQRLRPRGTPTPTPGPRGRPPRDLEEPRPTPWSIQRRGDREAPSVVIEKSGLEDESGFAPTPKGVRGTKWRYLTRNVRAEIDQARVKRRRWRYIVVHNSGTRQGNARIFDYYHRRTRKMKNGLAYHFVIGNGTSSGNGQIEIGDRWRRQINGGHVHSDYLNNIAIGICLVGDFNRHLPTRAQLESLQELINYLRLRTGKIDRRFAVVRAHKEVNPARWATDCPGDRFPVRWLHKTFN